MMVVFRRGVERAWFLLSLLGLTSTCLFATASTVPTIPCRHFVYEGQLLPFRYTCRLDYSLRIYAIGMSLCLEPQETNTEAVTIEFDESPLGPRILSVITDGERREVRPGEFQAGEKWPVAYDGTGFVRMHEYVLGSRTRVCKEENS